MRVYVVGLFFVILGTEICQAFRRAELIRQVWVNITGTAVQDLIADRRFPHRPTKITYLSTFDASPDADENYGQRIRGYFIPPVSGEYKFYSSCNNMCEVFLGFNGKGGEDNQIINQNRSSGHNEFERYPEQSSKPIILQKHTAYYLEAIGIHKKNPNHLSLGAKFPNGTKSFPLSGTYFQRNVKMNVDTVGSRRTKNRHGPIFSDLQNKLDTLGKLAHLYIKKAPSRKKFISDQARDGTGMNEGAKLVDSRLDNDEDSSRNRGKNGGQALLDVTGAEYSDSDSVEPGINIFPWEQDKKKQVDKVLASLPSAVTPQSDNQNIVRGPSFANVMGGAELASNNELAPNETVLEMNQIGKSLGPLAMNLVNITNFKVVIPGGKSYQVMGSREGKPALTVFPANGEKSNPNAPPEKQLAALDGSNMAATGYTKQEGPGLPASPPGPTESGPSMNGGMQAGMPPNPLQVPQPNLSLPPKDPVTVEKLTSDSAPPQSHLGGGGKPRGDGSSALPPPTGSSKPENSSEEPDIIKVEFVPEEGKAETNQASKEHNQPTPSSNPGSVKVEFVPHKDKTKPLSIKTTNEPVASVLPAIATAASNMMPVVKSTGPADNVIASVSQSPVLPLVATNVMKSQPTTTVQVSNPEPPPQQRAAPPVTSVTSTQMPGSVNGMQTVVGSVVNNASGQVTPFAVTVMTDPKQLQSASRGPAIMTSVTMGENETDDNRLLPGA